MYFYGTQTSGFLLEAVDCHNRFLLLEQLVFKLLEGKGHTQWGHFELGAKIYEQNISHTLEINEKNLSYRPMMSSNELPSGHTKSLKTCHMIVT